MTNLAAALVHTESRLFSRRLSNGFLSAFSHHQLKISQIPWNIKK